MGFPWSEGSLVASEPHSSRPGFPTVPLVPGCCVAGGEVVGEGRKSFTGKKKWSSGNREVGCGLWAANGAERPGASVTGERPQLGFLPGK